MGKIGVDIVDIVIIIFDNLRSEELMVIIKDIEVGIDKENYIVIENRKEVIKKVIDIVFKDDVIVIVGKGYEIY